MTRRILIVEDDISFGTILETWFKKNGIETHLCSTVETAKVEIKRNHFDALLTDLRLPDGDGIMLLGWVKEIQPTLPVIIMTSYAEIQSAVSAIKLGAFDYIEKPINPSLLKQKIEQLWKNEQPTQHAGKPKIVQGESKKACEMQRHIELVAPTRMTVLILGESGTGKEYAARLIHELSVRKEAPFLAVDCGSLSKELAPSELFGHLKGAFTSAVADKKGVFELAEGGTVFLDEVGNLPYEVQIQLLRALQEQKIRPVGAATDKPIDVRIIAATNENLEECTQNGKFREDLYHRLNEFSITTVPLRERIEDLPIFASHFLSEANHELEKNIKSISKETYRILEKHHWNGNLRELRNIIRRAALFAQTHEIIPENLPMFPLPSNSPENNLNLSLGPEREKELIMEALQKSDGNKSKAARLLKIDRKTLYNKMHQYDIEL